MREARKGYAGETRNEPRVKAICRFLVSLRSRPCAAAFDPLFYSQDERFARMYRE